jgi:hypothetical protein
MSCGDEVDAVAWSGPELKYLECVAAKCITIYGGPTVFNSWFALAYKAAQLGFDAQHVITLRLMRLASGGASAQTEAKRMISEKPAALLEAQIAAATTLGGGKSNSAAKKVLDVYKKRVRTNRRRLTRH